MFNLIKAAYTETTKLSENINITAAGENRMYIVSFRHENAFYMTSNVSKNADRSIVSVYANNLTAAIAFAKKAEAKGAYEIEVYPHN